MSVTVKNIIQEIEKIAPKTSACNWDNVGLVCGSLSNTVDKIYFCLELDEFVVEDILNSGSDLVILHHSPMFFPYKNLTDDNLIGVLLMKLIHAGISVYCAHTNWDNSPIGVNKQLAEILKIQ